MAWRGVAWLAAPWRWTTSLLTGLASTLAGRPPRRGLLIVVVAGLTVAVARALHQGQWMVGGVLTFVGLAAVLRPLADAAISRQAEFAADRFAAAHGLALELAGALDAVDDGRSAASGWSRRLLASHPTSDRRISALLAATAASRVWPEEVVPSGAPGTHGGNRDIRRFGSSATSERPNRPGRRMQLLQHKARIERALERRYERPTASVSLWGSAPSTGVRPS